MIAALLREHRLLEDRVHAMPASADQVLEVGQTLLAFARQEDEAFAALRPLLDPVVLSEMGEEHREIGGDLELLEWLVTSAPASPDVAVMTESLARRIRQHVSRDGRLLSRAVVMVDQ